MYICLIHLYAGYSYIMSIYKSTGSVYNIQFHFVWCTKYRSKVLTPAIQERLKELIQIRAEELNISILALEVQSDQVHCFVSVNPSDAPQHYVSQLKGITSHVLREEYSELRSKLPCLWSRSYYVASVGYVSNETIQDYIETQKNK